MSKKIYKLIDRLTELTCSMCPVQIDPMQYVRKDYFYLLLREFFLTTDIIWLPTTSSFLRQNTAPQILFWFAALCLTVNGWLERASNPSGKLYPVSCTIRYQARVCSKPINFLCRLWHNYVQISKRSLWLVILAIKTRSKRQ